ncbi:hypothetical protein QQG55_19480 [Brugia pahangi]
MDDSMGNEGNEYKQNDNWASSEEQPSTSANSNSSVAESVKRQKLSRKIHIAVAGCSHGEMDKIYATMAEIERREGYKFDLLISCGDYEAVRNYGDLKHMHVPEKYRHLQSFHRYYSGESEAPVLTIFMEGIMKLRVIFKNYLMVDGSRQKFSI